MNNTNLNNDLENVGREDFAEASEELIEICVEKAQKDLHVTLASGQKNAVITAIKNTTVIITGGPGTGKSATRSIVK